jgi:MtN3 and saliva related transmembrane protein
LPVPLPMLLVAAGVVLWIVYGILRGDFVVILANVLTLALVGVLLFLKFWVHVDRPKPPPGR